VRRRGVGLGAGRGFGLPLLKQVDAGLAPPAFGVGSSSWSGTRIGKNDLALRVALMIPYRVYDIFFQI